MRQAVSRFLHLFSFFPTYVVSTHCRHGIWQHGILLPSGAFKLRKGRRKEDGQAGWWLGGTPKHKITRLLLQTTHPAAMPACVACPTTRGFPTLPICKRTTMNFQTSAVCERLLFYLYREPRWNYMASSFSVFYYAHCIQDPGGEENRH